MSKPDLNDIDGALHRIAEGVMDRALREAGGAEQTVRAKELHRRVPGLTFSECERAARLLAKYRSGARVSYWHPCPDCEEDWAFRVPSPEAALDPKDSGYRQCDSCGEKIEIEDDFIYAVVTDSDPASMTLTLRNEAHRFAERLKEYGHPGHSKTLEKVHDALDVLWKEQEK